MRYPSSSIVRANLGRIYYFEGDFEKAKHYYSDSLRMDPHSANTANGLALTVWRLGDQKSALSILSNWIEREPDFVGSYVNRALILRGDLGLADLKHALSVRPDYKPALQLQSELLNEKPGINRSELKKLRP